METNRLREIDTNVRRFEIRDLPRGEYRCRHTSGLQDFVADNVVLESSRYVESDVPFEVGAANVEVTVRADAAVSLPRQGRFQEQFESSASKNAAGSVTAARPTRLLISLPWSERRPA